MLNSFVNEVKKNAITHGSIPFWSWNDKLEKAEIIYLSRAEDVLHATGRKKRTDYKHRNGGAERSDIRNALSHENGESKLREYRGNKENRKAYKAGNSTLVYKHLLYVHLVVGEHQVSPQTFPDLTTIGQSYSFGRVVGSHLKGIHNGSAGMLHIVAAGNIQGQLGT